MKRQGLWCIVVSFLFLFCLCACRQQETPQHDRSNNMISTTRPVDVTSFTPILSKSMKVVQYEVDVQALKDFLPHRGKTLVLLSEDPSLNPIPDGIRAEFDAVVSQGGQELTRRLWRVADPLVTPGMLTRAAVETRIFRRIIWVVPSVNPQEQLDLEKFTTLIKSLKLSGSETFRRGENGTISGEIDGVRFDVVHPAALPIVTEPVVLHIDLGYFAAIFKSEIKTPLVPLVGETLVKLRNTEWPISAITFSNSNHSGQVSLSFRPVGEMIQRLFAEPQLLDNSIPENWQLLGKVIYLENFFQNEEIQRLLNMMEKNEPNAAWVKYLRANFSRYKKDFTSAERYLAEAVKGEAAYALEYMELAEQAREDKKFDQVLANLRKVVEALPDDPLFRLSLCEELVAQKNFNEVRTMLPSLRRLPWSPVYFPQVPSALEYFQKVAEQ